MINLSKITIFILRYLLVLFMLNAGLRHFLEPDFYVSFVPYFLPCKEQIVFLSGVLEVALGMFLLFNIKVFSKNLAQWSALAIFIMMWVYLPIHISDVISSNPAIGSHRLAVIRLPFQFLFIAWAWHVYYFLNKELKQRA